MFADPAMKCGEPVVTRLQVQGCAELGLAARAFEEDDEIACDGECDVAAEILFDEGESEVDAGGDACRGPDRAVADEDRVGLDMHGGEAAGEFGAEGPVGHGAPPVEDTRGCEQESAGADGRDAAGGAGAGVDPAAERGVGGGGFGAGTAGDDEGVERGFGWWERESFEGETCGRIDVAGAAGDEAYGVWEWAADGGRELVGGGEDLERAGDVEELHRGEGKHLDGADRDVGGKGGRTGAPAVAGRLRSPGEHLIERDAPMDLTHIHAFTAAMQLKDLEAMLTHMAEDVTLHTPLVAEPVRGKAAIRQVVGPLLEVVDSFDFQEIMPGLRHVSSFFKLKAGDEELDGMDYWRLNEAGLIEEMRVLWRPLPAAIAVRDRLFS